ncbi:hypothetical protein BGP78_05345 [Pseudoalteromonas sp. MSK9-3]|uniref:serine hydrolase n=1 Tax=Pseudoalteromonas sp. MSK9-3 TaxID=1897633 RepID=UPI000E6D563C|nr:serine hydrolase [Pseudoalteromonas sp. MSK9-3]RJE78295.1 hypothetical protein BGP78_05345 [Pseudoalteromonas sp. MSK9-3]
MKTKLFLILLFLGGYSPLLMAASAQKAAKQTAEYLKGFPDLNPGYGLVVVTPDELVLNHVQGLRNSETKAPLTVNTPIYIASQTKAIVGLLAHKLDKKGVLKLDSTLADHWPQLKLPGAINAAEWTMSDLLNHMLPIYADDLVYLEAYVTELNYQDYPKIIETTAVKRESGFEYDNLGYNIYTAILHQATGKPWQQWLQEEIFQPLKMTKTSAKTSDFPLTELSWNHVWLGDDKGYIAVPPKTDAMMQSSGGVVTSTTDLAKWLQLHLKQGNQIAGFSHKLMTSAQQLGTSYEASDRNPYGMLCDGYAFGWNTCSFKEHQVYLHGGGYTGARTIMAFVPKLNVGIGIFSNSDNQTGWHTGNTLSQFLHYMIDESTAEVAAKERQLAYPKRIKRSLENRHKRIAKKRGEALWGSWLWKPARAELQNYVGTYHHPLFPKPVMVSLNKQSLHIQADSLQGKLEPAVEDLFGMTSSPLGSPMPIQFSRNADSLVEGVTLYGLQFKKQ